MIYHFTAYVGHTIDANVFDVDDAPDEVKEREKRTEGAETVKVTKDGDTYFGYIVTEEKDYKQALDITNAFIHGVWMTK